MAQSSDRSSTPEGKYFLSWKGKQTGPFSLAEIQAKLQDHEIGLVHDINASGEWMPLEEFLRRQQKRQQQLAQRDEEARRLEEIRAKDEERLRSEYEHKLALEEEKQDRLLNRVTDLEEKLRDHNVNRGSPPLWQNPPQGHRDLNVQQRTSGLAIAAFIMGLVNFVPLVNLVSWVLALIFGHVALSQIKNDPRLGGRGLAIAGISITYALLGIGVIIGLLYGFNSSTFYRFK